MKDGQQFCGDCYHVHWHYTCLVCDRPVTAGDKDKVVNRHRDLSTCVRSLASRVNELERDLAIARKLDNACVIERLAQVEADLDK